MTVKTYILMLTMAILVSACANDATEEMPSIPTDASGVDDAFVPVRLSVSDQHIFDITRSATSIITFNANESVMVFVKPDGATSFTPYIYTTASNGQTTALNTPVPPPYFPAGDSTSVLAYAYYPASATTSFSVQDDQTSDANYKLSDLMFAAQRLITKDVDDGNNVLTMNHQMAQLRITANPQIGSGLTIAAVEVEAKKSVTFTPEAETIITTTGDPGSITALNAAGTGYIVIPPQEIEGIVIRVKTGAGTPAETATYIFHSTGSFAAGSSYGINLTVTDEQLGTTSFINDWTGLNSVNVTPSGDRDLVILPIGAQEFHYTGFAHEPDVSVLKDDILIDKDDYTKQYVNNTDAGRAYIIVVGKSGTSIEGCVGIASFTIAQANAEISYASDTETKTYGNPRFTKPLTNTGDGAVTYTSSNPEVVSVNATTGEVTILKSGETTITASVENGANFVYKSDKKTASYTLTVSKAVGTITFGSANPIKTWSANSANNTFTQNVTNSGTGPVSYAIGDVNNCGATINGSTVSFTQSGIAVVTATVEDDDRYTYAKKNVSYILTVNKAVGYVSLTTTSGNVRAGNSATITVNTSHGGTLSAVATSGATDRIESIAGPVNNKFTFVTNGTSPTSVTITVTCDATDKYLAATATYTLTIKSAIDIWMNPLYYVSEYNIVNEAGTTFGSKIDDGYFFNWQTSMNKFAAQTTSYDTYKNAGKGPGGQWHLPIHKEWWSIVPGEITDIRSFSGYKPSYIRPVWGYNSATKNPGILESSYWRRIGTNEVHAIRFLGTDYCSAWKYIYSNKTLTIYATLIETVANNSTAAVNWYNTNFNNVTWGNNVNEGAVVRQFYASGYIDNGNGPYNSSRRSQIGQYGKFWATTLYKSGYGYRLFFHSNGITVEYLFITAGFTIRLFRDH